MMTNPSHEIAVPNDEWMPRVSGYSGRSVAAALPQHGKYAPAVAGPRVGVRVGRSLFDTERDCHDYLHLAWENHPVRRADTFLFMVRMDEAETA